MALKITLTELPEGPDATWLVGGQHQYVRRVQCVLEDDGQEPTIDPLNIGPYDLLTQSTIENFGLQLGKPWEYFRDGQVRDTDPLARCRSVQPQRDPVKRNRWFITATYNTLSESDNTYNDAGDQDTGDWLTERPFVQMQQVFFTEHAKDGYGYSKGPRDADGHAVCEPDRATSSTWVELDGGAKGGIVNSQGGWMGDPPPERDMERAGWIVERNMNTIDEAQIARLTNSVNTFGDFTFTWKGKVITIPRYFGKLKSIVPRDHFRGGSWVYRVRYEFDVWDKSWVEDFLDQGFQAVDFKNIPSVVFGQTQQQNITDPNQLLTTIPALLDGKGQPKEIVTEAGLENFKISSVCYRSYLLYEKENWSDTTNNWMLNNFPNNYNYSP